MSKIKELLNSIETFKHKACAQCPWNVKGMAFGISCTNHHFKLDSDERVAIMSIGQDPGGTTPEKTGTLCGFCNSVNATDKTAVHSFDLLKTAVIGDQNYQRDQTHPIFKQWYVTNCIKHGIPTSRFSGDVIEEMKQNKESARQYCRKVLKDEINILQPKLIKAAGLNAVRSLFDIGLIGKTYSSMKLYVENSPFTIKNFYSDGSNVTVFCIFHTSARVTNQTLSRFYNDSIREEIDSLMDNHPNPVVVEAFIKKYNKPDSSGKYTIRNGMMVHLRDWLKFGELARELCTEKSIKNFG